MRRVELTLPVGVLGELASLRAHEVDAPTRFIHVAEQVLLLER